MCKWIMGKDVFVMGFFQKLFGKSVDSICAPVAGKAVPISQVSDPTFGEEILGKGIAIEPASGRVVAPCVSATSRLWLSSILFCSLSSG